MKKSKTKKVTSKRKSSPVPSNGTTELRDDELRSLALNHKGLFERALAAKKAKDADFRNACKKIKSELGDSGVAIIKAMIELDSPEGETAVLSRIRAQAKAARWNGLPVGTQVELALDVPDRTPAVDKARDAGKQASMEDALCKPPYAPNLPQYKAWMDGYQDHRATMLGRGKKDDPRPKLVQNMETEGQKPN